MNILIVEDDPMVSSINRGFLKKINAEYKIYDVPGIAEAKDFILKKDVDIVLLDVYLSGSNGPDLLKWIRENDWDIEVVLITSDNSAETVELAFRYGALDYLIKPFNFDRFKAAIEKAVNRRNQLENQETIDQSFIDRMIQSNIASDEPPSEKGVNPITYDMIMSVLKSTKCPLTAQLVAQKTDLARVTVRRYLEYMVKIGEAEEMLNYGKVGRPQKAYILNKKGKHKNE
jgi:response regulator of citrate/malate metabolism